MKRILVSLIQISITLGLLWWIFRDPAKNKQMLEAVHTADLRWLFPAFLSIGGMVVLQTERWRILLVVQGIHMGWWRTFRVYLIGCFFNLFLLGATGGDVIKIYYAMRETASKKSAAFLSVLVDRMMGLVGLVAIAIVLCSLRLPLILSKPLTSGMFGTIVVIMGASIAMIVFGFLVDRFNLVHRLPKGMPFHAKIAELATAFSTYARDPKALLKAFGLSLPAHLCMFFAFYLVARAFGAFAGPGGLLDILGLLPIILTIAAMPISLSGLGVRETLFKDSFFQLFGTPENISVPISLTGFLIIVAWGLIGGIVYMIYRPSGGIHLDEVEKEVAAVEDEIEKA